tara:strand:+ start:966 stop:1277 length:312 start_codon:yes stop_codon:yes gene_type:complete
MRANKRKPLFTCGDLVKVKEPAFVNRDHYHRVGIVMRITHELESPFYSERFMDINLYREHPEVFNPSDEVFEYVPLYLVMMYNGVKEEFFDGEIELVSSYLQP